MRPVNIDKNEQAHYWNSIKKVCVHCIYMKPRCYLGTRMCNAVQLKWTSARWQGDRRTLGSAFHGAHLRGIVPMTVKLSLCFNWAPRHEGVLGEWTYSSTHSLTSVLDEGEWSASRPGRFTPRYTLDRRLDGPQNYTRTVRTQSRLLMIFWKPASFWK
jgi:hypothetical protein